MCPPRPLKQTQQILPSPTTTLLLWLASRSLRMQLLIRRRRRTRPTEIHRRKPIHDIAHRSTAHDRLLRRAGRRVEQAHHVSHTARRPSSTHRRTIGSIGRRRDAAALLVGRGRGAVKVDVEQVLDVALGLAPVSGGCGSGCGSDGVLGGFAALLLDGGALDLVGAVATLAHEGLWWLVVDGGEGGELAEELLQESGWEAGNGGGNGGLLGEDDVLYSN